jgi:ankyrin repeat protein
MLAIAKGHVEVVKVLVAAGADLNAQKNVSS